MDQISIETSYEISYAPKTYFDRLVYEFINKHSVLVWMGNSGHAFVLDIM